MIYKMTAQRRWRALRGFEWLAKVIKGVKFQDGMLAVVPTVSSVCNRHKITFPQSLTAWG